MMQDGVESSIPLTHQQRRFMLALQERIAAFPDVGPTYEELRADLGLASKSGVARLVSECVERGRIIRIPRAERSLRVIRPVSSGAPREVVPLISSFTDSEIIREACRRGLLSISSG